MSRVEYGTITFSDTSTPNQLRSTTGRALAVVFKSRAANTGSVYIGTDTTISRTNGFELLPGDREDWSFTGSHDSKLFYAVASDSTMVLDWLIELES